MITFLVILAIFLGFIGYIIYCLSGNKAATKAAPAKQIAAKTYKAEPGKAALYVARFGFVGTLQDMLVDVSGVGSVQMRGGQFVKADVAPGQYTVFAKMARSKLKPGQLDFEVEAGQVVIVKIVMAMGAIKGKIAIDIVDHSGQARAIIDKAKMIEFKTLTS